MAGALPTPGPIEQGHGRTQPDLVADHLQDVAGGAPIRRRNHRGQVSGQPHHLGRVFVRQRVGDAGDLVGRPGRPTFEALGEPRGQAPGGAAQDLDDVSLFHPTSGGGQAQVRQRGPHAGALEHVGGEDRPQRDPGLGQGHVGREQQRVDPGQHGDGRRLHAGLGQPRADQVGGDLSRVVGAVLDHPERTGGGVGGRAGIDLLGHATVVVAEQRAGSRDHLDRAAVVDLQGVVGRSGEEFGVVDEVAGIGTDMAVDGLVVVTDPEDVEAGQGQQAQQQHVRRGEVLELVDQQVTAPALEGAPELAVSQQRLDGAVDLLVEVDHAPIRQGLSVRVEDRREPVDIVSLGLDLIGRPQAQAHRPERFEVRTDGIGVGSTLTPAREQGLDQTAGVALVDHAGRPPALLGQDPQPERVEGLHPGRERRRAPLELELGLFVVGHRQHAGSLPAPVGHQVAEPFGQDPRLARTGGRDDPGRPPGVGHRRQLVGSQVRVRRHLGRREGETPELDRLGVDDAVPAQSVGFDRLAGSAVDPGGAPVGQHHVGRPVGRLGRPEAQRLAGPPPDGFGSSGVVVVGPDQEVEPIGPRLEPRGERPHWFRDLARVTEPGRVDAQGHHHRLPGHPVPVETLDHLGRHPKLGFTHGDHGRAHPRRRDGAVLGDDDTATERDGTGNCHGTTLRTPTDSAPDPRPPFVGGATAADLLPSGPCRRGGGNRRGRPSYAVVPGPLPWNCASSTVASGWAPSCWKAVGPRTSPANPGPYGRC